MDNIKLNILGYTTVSKTIFFISGLLYVSSIFFENITFALSGSLLLIYISYSKLIFKNILKNIDIEVNREILEKIKYVNKPFNIVIKIKIKGKKPAIKINMKDKIPDRCYIHKSSNEYSAYLSDNEIYEYMYSVYATARGSYTFENIEIKFRDTKNLFIYERVIQHNTEIRVHSDIDTIKKDAEIGKKINIDITRKSKSFALKTREFEGVRKYIPGDTLRDIDWKSSSRLQKLMTKIFEEETVTQCIILIDCSKNMRKGIKEFSKLEHVILLSLELVQILQSKGSPVGLITFDEYKILDNIIPSQKQQYNIIANRILYIPNTIIDENKTNINSLETKTELLEDETLNRYISLIGPFLSTVKRRYQSPLEVTGIYEAIRTVSQISEKKIILILFTDIEKNFSSLCKSLSVIKKYQHRLILILPFTEWYHYKKEDITVEILEKLYLEYMNKQTKIKKIRNMGIQVLEIGPKEHVIKIVKQMETKKI